MGLVARQALWADQLTGLVERQLTLIKVKRIVVFDQVIGFGIDDLSTFIDEQRDAVFISGLHQIGNRRDAAHAQWHVIQTQLDRTLDPNGRSVACRAGGEHKVVLGRLVFDRHPADGLASFGVPHLVDPLFQQFGECCPNVVTAGDFDNRVHPVDRHVKGRLAVCGVQENRLAV